MAVRDAFLDRVRRAAEQGRQYRVHLQSVPAEIGYLGAGSDPVARFVEELNAVGGEAIVVQNADEARSTLQKLVAELQARSAVCWQHDLLTDMNISELLNACGMITLDHSQLADMPPDARRAKLLACDVGITSCDCAIAETGTLVMCSRPGQERVASLLPPTHIAIIHQRQIVADLIDAFGLLERQELPGNVTLITGPSKTGDIELQLTTGVHGPGRLYVLVIARPVLA